MEKMNQVSVSEFMNLTKTAMYDKAVEMVEKYNRLIDICNDSADRIATIVKERDKHEEELERYSAEIERLTQENVDLRRGIVGEDNVIVSKTLYDAILQERTVLNEKVMGMHNIINELSHDIDNYKKDIKYWKTKYLATEEVRNAFMEEAKELHKKLEGYNIPTIKITPDDEEYARLNAMFEKFKNDLGITHVYSEPPAAFIKMRGVAADFRSSVICPQIEKVYFNGPTTTALFSDGSHTCCTCGKGDTWNPDAGVAICIAKRIYGDNFKRKFKDLIGAAKEAKDNKLWKAQAKIDAKNKVKAHNGEDSKEAGKKKARSKKEEKE